MWTQVNSIIIALLHCIIAGQHVSLLLFLYSRKSPENVGFFFANNELTRQTYSLAWLGALFLKKVQGSVVLSRIVSMKEHNLVDTIKRLRFVVKHLLGLF